MEGYFSTGQSPQWAVVSMEEEEEEEEEEECVQGKEKPSRGSVIVNLLTDTQSTGSLLLPL